MRRAPLFLFCLLLIAVGCSNNDPLIPSISAPTLSDDLTYAGSAECKTCHSAIYETWKDSRHTKKVRAADLTTVVNDSDNNGTNDFVQGGPGVTFAIPWAGYTLAPGIEFPHLGWDGTNLLLRVGPVTYNVTFLLGGTGKWKQRYMITIDNQEYISPVQYNDITREYVSYHPENWYTLNGTQLTGYLYNSTAQTPITEGEVRDSWQRRCMGCHVTGVRDASKNADGEYGGSINQLLSNQGISELPVSCEACHGPSARHVELGGGKGTTINPTDMAADLGDQVCGGCHVRGTSTNAEGFGYPWKPGSLVDGGFRPGDTVTDFYTPVARDGSKFWDNAAQSASSHHQQWIEHADTPHGKAGVTCWKCHDPHGSGIEGDLKMPTTQLCISCHDGQGNIDSTNLELHTKHKTPSAQSCNNCHFNLTAKSGIKYDVNSHTYKVIYPHETTRVGVPNSCAKCHTEESENQLTGMLATRWPMVTPVAVARYTSLTNGTMFGLEGDLSFDPLERSDLTYDWQMTSGPPNFDRADLLAQTGSDALFIPSSPGLYTFTLYVANRDGIRSHPSMITVDVTAGVVQTTPDLRTAEYVGSTVCAGCHKDTHTSWEVTRHTQKTRRPFEGYGVVFVDTNLNGVSDWMEGPFNLATDPNSDRTVFDDYVYSDGIEPPVIDFDGTTYTVTVGPVTYDITWILGGTGKWKQRFMATLDEGEYILPIQFNELTNAWVNYHVEHWYTFVDDNGNGAADPGEMLMGYLYNSTAETPVTQGTTRNSWQRRCTWCHSTGAREMQRQPNGEYGASIQTMLDASSGSRLAETGIGCEACHGPGSIHILGPRVRGSIVNQSKLSTQRNFETCGQCHNRGSSVNSEGYGYPWNENVDGHYLPGDVLDNFYKPVQPGSKRFWKDPYDHAKSHHEQWLDIQRSAHFGAGVTCAKCHTTHTDEFNGQLKVQGNQLCLSCHNNLATDAGRYKNHSRHENGSPGNDCVSCHLPLVAKSAINYDISAHTFKIIFPVNSADMIPSGTVIPNSCMTRGCHSTGIGDLDPWTHTDLDSNNEATMASNYM